MSKVSRDFKKALMKLEKTSEKIIRATALQLFSAIVDDTPVDEGRLRGNWQATLGQPSQVTVSINDKSGNPTKSKIGSTVNKLELNKSVFLTNNLPYANVIENGDVRIRGHFMVKRAVASFESELKKQAMKNKKL